jgi:TolB-like protein/DNA-binding winged helix-turn-helix (wHTH) protein
LSEAPVQTEIVELDLRRYELRRGSNALKLEKIPMELLILLVERRDQLVGREEIIARLWGKDVFLDTEQGINTAIRKIRLILGDDPNEPRFLQTIVGKGYRFIGPISVVGGAPAAALAPASAPASAISEEPPPSRSQAALRWTLVALAAFSTVYFLARFHAFPRNQPMTQLAVHSIAVLPFENLSGDPGQDYFADGVTDELITMLAKNSGLRVISRTSVMRYQKVKRPLPDIARELGVDGIVEGSAGRFGTRVHINVQLIYAPSDTHVWAESYDRAATDVVSLQSELAQTISRQVGVTVSASSYPSKPINPEAHDAYLMGRYYWFASNFDKSRDYFQKAVGLQPDYAAAWSGIADSYIAPAVGGDSSVQTAVTNGEPAAKKALALDDSVAEAHVTMAAVYFFLHWDLVNADRESRRAIEIDPRLALAHQVRASILQTLWRTDEALQQTKEGMEFDPFAEPEALARALIHARKFDAAIAEARLRKEAQPDSVQLHDMLLSAYTHKGMEKEAAEEWEAELQLSGDKQGALAVHQAFTRGGLNAVHEWQLSGFIKRARTQYVAKLDLAAICAHLRRKEEALHYLELAYQEHEPLMVTVQNMPSFDFLHSEPRYQAIVNKMGLPPAQ